MRRTARSSRALAPSPYTVSVGNATRRPARISAPARSISRESIPATALFRQLVFAVAGRLAGFAEYQVGVHQPFHVAVQHTVHVAHAELRAVVLDEPVRRQHVAADLAAEVDLEFGVLDLARRGA